MNIKDFVKVRKMLGMSQYDFAVKVGLSAGYIACLESGAKPFNKRLERKFLDALNMDEEEVQVLASLHDELRRKRVGDAQ